MAYLWQLYRQENSLKCRLRNKLLIDDIHKTITERRGCVAEGTGKQNKPTPKKWWTWEWGCTVRNCLTWFNCEIFLLMQSCLQVELNFFFHKCGARAVDYVMFKKRAGVFYWV